jgi:ParB family transcriptional regulator, chromosome partitioning protein
MAVDRLDLDLHRLELRFAASRVVEPRAVERLARSIEQCGQIVPCIAVAEANGAPLVLVDGYRRVAALRRLGRDAARVERWQCELAEALVRVLARAEGRPLAAIEEALLIRELVHGLGLSQHELARRCGRDVSWVSRRLALLAALPDAALAAVRQGGLSSWAACRVVVPLARANSEHADRLIEGLRRAPLSTRELRCWFDHYRKASRIVRERMVDQPRLFLDAVRESGELRDGKRLRDGPEGECRADLRIIEAVIARLRKRLQTLRPLPAFLRNAVPRLGAAMTALTQQIERCCDDPERDPQDRANAGGAGQEGARDQQTAGPVA